MKCLFFSLILILHYGISFSAVPLFPPDSVECEDELIYNWGEEKSIKYLYSKNNFIYCIACPNFNDTLKIKEHQVEQIIFSDGRIQHLKQERKENNKLDSGQKWLIATAILLGVAALYMYIHVKYLFQ